MSVIELKRKVYQFKLDGNTYDVRCPSVEQIKQFSNIGEKDSFEALVDLLDQLGMPKSVLMDLDFDIVEQIADVIIPKKKK